MQWYFSLTRNQQRILLGLALTTLAAIGGLTLLVWNSLPLESSPLPTPGVLSVAPSPTPPATVAPTRTPSPTPSPTASPTPAFDMARAGLIAEEVAASRGVVARWITPLVLVDNHDLIVYLYKHHQESSPLVLQARPALSVLGIWRWPESPELDSRVQARRLAALYAPDEGQIYLRKDWPGTIDELQMQLAFGYARALPDQYSDLPRLIDEAVTLDNRLALLAVADGDALLALWRYYEVKPGSPEAEALTERIIQAVAPQWKPTDPLLEDISRASLRLGAQFAATIYNTGGSAALDRVLRRPPRSTQQVLHPERISLSAEPLTLDVAYPPLSNAWALTQTDTLGEAWMGLTLLEWGSAETTATLTHWNGDTLQAWRGPKGARLVLWQTAWDDWQAAQQFVELTEPRMPRQGSSVLRKATTPDGLPAGQWWEGPSGAAFLYRYGKRVWLVWGDDSGAVKITAQHLTNLRAQTGAE